MQITQVRVSRRDDMDGKIKARVTVTFDEQFVVHGVRVVDGQNGLFVAMPGRRSADGEFKDIAHPITSDLRNDIQSAVLQAYFADM